MAGPDAAQENPIRAFAAWTSDVAADWPDEAWQAATDAFVDTIGVMVPGAVEPVTRRVTATVETWGAGRSAAAGHAERLAAPWAALVNGTAAHALDFDDNFDPAKAHASAVLAPAILAVADAEGASGADCLDAYIVGLQVLGRTGQGLNPYHRNRGWHATSTTGAIGAAAACARLLKLDAEQAANALSIATSMAGGSMAQFGTMTKPLHAGLAAKAGVMAASLARSGVDAGMSAFDGPRGIQRLMVGPDFEALRDGLEHVEHGQDMRFKVDEVGEPLLVLSSGLKVKRFPNCGSAHRAMDALLHLRDKHGFAADEIAKIRVSAPVSHLNNLMYEDPVGSAQGKFSLEYGLARIAFSGGCTLADFTDEAVADPQVRELYPVIERNPVDKAEGEFPTEVEVSLRDGDVLSNAMAMPVGSKANPLSADDLRAKFLGCAAGHFGEQDTAELFERVSQLRGQASLAPITDILRKAGPTDT